MYKYTFVIGNGKSREGLTLHPLMLLGQVIGCNALYREFHPHILVALDTSFFNHLIEIEYHLNDRLVTKMPKRYKDRIPGVEYFDRKHDKVNSGTVAFQIAVDSDPDEIFLIGFDLGGPNMYAGQPGYHQHMDADPEFIVHKHFDKVMQSAKCPVWHVGKNLPIETFKREVLVWEK
jgi:hypothetical protein